MKRKVDNSRFVMQDDEGKVERMADARTFEHVLKLSSLWLADNKRRAGS